jgi:hypothetical protein
MRFAIRSWLLYRLSSNGRRLNAAFGGSLVAQPKMSATQEKEIATMRFGLASTTCLLLILCHAVLGQEAKKLQEPEYLGVFFFLDSTTGALVPLERQTPEVKSRSKSLGLRGGESSFEFKGSKSPVRFTADQRLEFVVRVSSQQIDPVDAIQFFSFESKQGTRELVLYKESFKRTGSVVMERVIRFNAVKYGESSFKVTPAQNLPPGEYSLGAMHRGDGFCFGIDPANPKQ